MRPLYHEINSQLEVFTKKNNTLPLHLHKYLECIYVTEGTLRLGIGADWFEIKPHDFAMIFPDMIHQFQAEGSDLSQAIYVLGTPAAAGSFADILQRYYPRTPVIGSGQVHPEISYALQALLRASQEPYGTQLQYAYFQVLLARMLPVCELAEKRDLEYADLAGRTIAYISEHFREELSLAGIAHELCVSPYVLSRIFSGVLHTNFNRYLNEIRLDYASHLLRTTEKSVTDIFAESGFNSQTTFNRVFQTKFHVSPRDYRRQNQVRGDSFRQPFSVSEEMEKEDGNISGAMGWQLARGHFL